MQNGRKPEGCRMRNGRKSEIRNGKLTTDLCQPSPRDRLKRSKANRYCGGRLRRAKKALRALTDRKLYLRFREAIDAL